MTEQRQAFDTVGDQFIAYYDTVRGHIREVLTRQNLAPYIASPGVALDVGGGDGRDAVWLAQEGWRVTLIDPSEDMVTKAHKNVAAAKVEDRVTVLQGDPAELLRADNAEEFDLVMSHGVLMYLDDFDAHAELLSRHVTGSGVVSILTRGMAGSLTRIENSAMDAVTKAAEITRLKATGSMTNNLGEQTHPVTPGDMRQLLGRHYLEIVDWRGVRVDSDDDYRQITAIPPEELQDILTTEARLGRDERVKANGQMLHFIAGTVLDGTFTENKETTI